MRNFCVFVVIAITVASAVAMPHTKQQGYAALQKLKQQGSTNGEFDDIVDQVTLTVDAVELAFMKTHAALETALNGSVSSEVLDHVLNVTMTAEVDAEQVFLEAIFEAIQTPDLTLEDLALLVQNTLVRLGPIYVQAVTKVERVVEVEAPEALPQVHKIILQLGAEIEVAVKPLLELINPLLPRL